MTQRHGQQSGSSLWEWGLGWVEEDKVGEIRITVIDNNKKLFQKIKINVLTNVTLI